MTRTIKKIRFRVDTLPGNLYVLTPLVKMQTVAELRDELITRAGCSDISVLDGPEQIRFNKDWSLVCTADAYVYLIPYV